MKRNNVTETSQKQIELKKKLQEIRRQRLEMEQTGADTMQPEMRTQKRNPNKKNRNKKQQQTRQRSNNQEHQGKSEPISLESTDDSYSLRNYSQAKNEAARKSKKRQEMAQQKPKKKKNPLLNQLSNSENLAQAFILSEVLSKPVALRKRRR